MGWWHAGEHGESLQTEPTGLAWGDGPADEMERALANITALFQGAWGRKPTVAELRSGLEFSLGGYEET